VRALVHDPSPGIGGGQRWSRDFAEWLSRRGHEVLHSAERTPPRWPCDVFFDMTPVGDPALYPPDAVVYLWCHVPSSLKAWACLDRAKVIASSSWSAGRVEKSWNTPSVPLLLFGCPHAAPARVGVLFHGRLTHAKGVYRALEAYRMGRFDVPLTISGATWSTPPETLVHIEQACVQASVGFRPDDPEPETLHRTHSIFWNLASGPPEAFGLAAADALLSGLSVIALSDGGIGEWLPSRFQARNLLDVVTLTQRSLAGDLQPPTEDEKYLVTEAAFTQRVEESGLPW